jgi:hypothetical protein
MILGFAALAAGGIAPALATVPENLNLPVSASTAIPLPKPQPVEFLAGETLPLSKDLHLEFAGTVLNQPLQLSHFVPSPAAPSPQLELVSSERQTRAASLEWDFSKWGSLGLVTASGAESPTLLGDFMPQPLFFTDTATTSGAGFSAHAKLGDGWVTSFSYSMDVRQLDLRGGPSATLAERSTRGQSFGISIAKHGVFGNADALGLSVSRPSDEYFGSITLADAGLENGVNLVGNYPGISFNTAKETDVALGYETHFFNGALSLQANAGYQMNAGGQNGQNSVTVLSRAKINF